MTSGREEGWGRGSREKVRRAIVHKAGSKTPTNMTDSISSLETLVKTTFSFGVFIVNYSMTHGVTHKDCRLWIDTSISYSVTFSF